MKASPCVTCGGPLPSYPSRVKVCDDCTRARKLAYWHRRRDLMNQRRMVRRARMEDIPCHIIDKVFEMAKLRQRYARAQERRSA